MADYRYPYVKQPNWNQYREANDGGAFDVPNPDMELYRYYQNFPFQNEYMNQPIEMGDETVHRKNIYYAAGRNPQNYKYYSYPDQLDRNLSPFSAMEDVEPPLLNPTVLINRELDNDYLRHRPPSYDHQEKDRIDALKIRRDIDMPLPTPYIDQHVYDDLDIDAIKIRRDTMIPKKTPKHDQHDFDEAPITSLKIKRDFPGNFDETPVKPLKKNPFLSFDDTPVKPLGYNYSNFMTDKFTPPTTVDSSIKSATPIKKKKPPQKNFKKATSFDVPVNENIEPIKQQPQKRFVTMKLNKESPRFNNTPINSRFPNLDRKPIKVDNIIQNDPTFNQNPFTSKSPLIRADSPKKSNKPQTLINTKYVIINQNDSIQPTPRDLSAIERNFTSRKTPVVQEVYQQKPKLIQKEAPKKIYLASPRKNISESPSSPLPPIIPILSPLPLIQRPVSLQTSTPPQKVRRQQTDSPTLIRTKKNNSKPQINVAKGTQRRAINFENNDEDVDDYEDENIDPIKGKRKTFVHHYFK